MYSVQLILSAAGVATQIWTKGGVTVKLTANNQLIGTHSELTRFRQANQSDYQGWESHHIFEDQDVRRLGLAAFSPVYDEMICVLIPSGAHQAINRDLRKWNPPRDLPTAADLETAYSEAYREDLSNYCGASSVEALRQELMKIVGAVLKNLLDAADKSLTDQQLKKLRDALRTLEGKLSLQKNWHDSLLQGSTPSALQAATFAGSLLSPLGPLAAGVALVNPANRAALGGAVGLLNRQKKPPLSIWNKMQDHVGAGWRAVMRGDRKMAALEIGLAEAYFQKAEIQFRHWREGQELAARHTELVIAAAAIVASLVATGLFAAEAAGTTATAGVAVGTTAEAGTAAPARVAQFVRVEVATVDAIVNAEDVAAEAAAEGRFVEPIKRVLRMS